jgi:hypothetical protein
VIIFILKKIIHIHFILDEEAELVQVTSPSQIDIEPSYRGPHIHMPIHKGHLEALIHAFQRGEVRA